MNKKIIIPIALCVIIMIASISTCIGGSSKVKLEWDKVTPSTAVNDSIELKVYVENSGSMDAYMCSGSNLKDAVFDYVSDLKRNSTSCSLFYINSRVIQRPDDLESYIKNLTPSSFAQAGGNRGNTDLMKIFKMVMEGHELNTVSVFVSDCILDIPESATDFFGQCQVSIKHTFNEAMQKNPSLGVEIIKLESKFDGYWYCGKNSAKLTDVKRPYYIWVIGDQKKLAQLNKKVPVEDIIGGIKEYCAYSPSCSIPFDIDKDTYVVNHTGKIKVQLLVNLDESLQQNSLILNPRQFVSANPNQVVVSSIDKITAKNSSYSHVVEIEIDNPETLRSESITFTYPSLASWVAESDDSTGENIEENIDKTTGIMSLVKGVSEAYKNSTDFGVVKFNLKNK